MRKQSEGHQSTNRISKKAATNSRTEIAVRNDKPSGNGHSSKLVDVPYNEYQVGDARHLGAMLHRQQVIDVTVTSPPYWDIKDYGGAGQIGHGQSLNQYLDDLVAVFTEVWHCTKRTGSLWIVINTIKKNNILHLLPFKLADRLTGLPTAAWYLQDILVWVKPHTLPWGHKQKLQDHFEYVLCFSKSKSFSLNVDALRSPQSLSNWWVKYPERYHPLGKGLNNVWEIHIPTQGAWGNGSMEHACPLPTELTKRIIQLATDKNGVVCDPFAGTGASVVAAQGLGRKWIALDINRRYREMCHKRLAEESGRNAEPNDIASLRDTNLRLRQLKYSVTLYKRIAPGLRLTVEDVPILAVRGGKHLRKPEPAWVTGTAIVVVVSDTLSAKKVRELTQAIEDNRQVPPLSKFQIGAEVRVVRLKEFAKSDLFPRTETVSIYTSGHFWQVSREGRTDNLVDTPNKSKFPVLISDIRVDEQPAY